jgi:hypothetical protein
MKLSIHSQMWFPQVTELVGPHTGEQPDVRISVIKEIRRKQILLFQDKSDKSFVPYLKIQTFISTVFE